MDIKTVYQRADVYADGQIIAVWMKTVRADNGAEIFSQPHRVPMTPVSLLAERRVATDTGLIAMGYPPTSDADWEKIDIIAQAQWTQDIVAAWTARAEAEG